MANINARSPYLVRVYDTAISSVDLDVWIYTGTQSSDPTSDPVTYTLTSTPVNGEVTFDISPLVKDYFEITFNGNYSTEVLWVDYRVTKNLSEKTVYYYSSEFYTTANFTNSVGTLYFAHNAPDYDFNITGTSPDNSEVFNVIYTDASLQTPYTGTSDIYNARTDELYGYYALYGTAGLVTGYAQGLQTVSKNSDSTYVASKLVTETTQEAVVQNTAFYGYGYFEEGANPQNNGFNTPNINTILDSSFSPDVYNDWELNNIGRLSWIPGDKSNIDKNGFIRKVYGLSGTAENFLQETLAGDLLDKSWWAHFHFQARSDVYNHLAFRVVWTNGTTSDKRVVLNIATQKTVQIILNQFEDDEVRLTNIGQISEFANMWRLSVKVNPVEGETERLLRIHPATYNASGAFAPINNSSTYQYIGMCYLTENYTSEPIFAYKRNSNSSDYDIKFEDDWIGFSTQNIFLPEGHHITVPFIRNNDYNFTGTGFGLYNSDGTWTYITYPTPSASESDEVVVYETYNDLQAIHSGERIYKINYVCEPKYTPYKLTFVNKYGVLEDLWFFKNSKLSIETKEEGYRANILNSGSYSISNHQYKTLYKEAKESLTINSGFYPESHNEAFKQLLLSEQVWINYKGQTLPCKIKDSSMSFKTQIQDKLISYTMNIEFAFDKINNVR